MRIPFLGRKVEHPYLWWCVLNMLPIPNDTESVTVVESPLVQKHFQSFDIFEIFIL